MNRNSVSDGKSRLDRKLETEKTPFMKVHSVGDKLFNECSPIVKNATTETKKAPPRAVRQKRNPWTKEEDNQLVALIKQERCNTLSSTKESTSIVYVKIAANLNSGRSAKQCRDRWQNFLRDGIKKGDWTVDEEELIKDLYATFGAKWSVMAKLFKDRSDNDIKNKWYSMKRKDERNGTHECKNPFADMFAVPNSTAVPEYTPSSLLAAAHMQSKRKIEFKSPLTDTNAVPNPSAVAPQYTLSPFLSATEMQSCDLNCSMDGDATSTDV